MKTILFQAAIAGAVWCVWFIALGFETALLNVRDHLDIALTMLFGSFVAGSTSLGGGAVAFPVFTKVLAIPSDVTLVFSLAIQSVGMTAAAVLIFLNRMPVCIKVLLWSILPGAIGIFTGLFLLGDYIVGAQAKILFSVFSVFVAVALIVERKVSSLEFKNHTDSAVEGLTYSRIVIAGFVGGVLSGLIGTGIDFVMFALMIFFSRLGLKQAIVTSVCVMAVNAIIGFAFIYFLTDRFNGEAVNYWLAAVPIVVIGAPLGALACRYFHRDIIFYFLLLLIVVDVVSTLSDLNK